MESPGRVEVGMAGRAEHGPKGFLNRLAARLSSPLGGAPRALAASPGPVLLLLGDAPRSYQLRGPGPWWVGRGPRADVPLDDPFVSRRHLRVRRHGGAFTVEAARGVLNAASLDLAALPPGIPVLLAPGSVLVAGQSRLLFEPSRAPRRSGAAAAPRGPRLP